MWQFNLYFQNRSFQNLSDKRKNVLFVAGNNLPLNFFEKPLTKAYLKNPPVSQPSGKYLQKNVAEEVEEMEENLIDILRENSSEISCTFDAWSKKDLSHYYGLTVHFINKNWFLVSLGLDLISAKNQHGGNFLLLIRNRKLIS